MQQTFLRASIGKEISFIVKKKKIIYFRNSLLDFLSNFIQKRANFVEKMKGSKSQLKKVKLRVWSRMKYGIISTYALHKLILLWLSRSGVARLFHLRAKVTFSFVVIGMIFIKELLLNTFWHKCTLPVPWKIF